MTKQDSDMSLRYLNKNRTRLNKNMRVQFTDVNPFVDDDSTREITDIQIKGLSSYWAQKFFQTYYPDIANTWVLNWTVVVTSHFDNDYQEVQELRAKCRFHELDHAARDAVIETYKKGNPNHFTHVTFDCTTVPKFKKLEDECEEKFYALP